MEGVITVPLGHIEPHKHLLKQPDEDQLLYKVISVENLLSSIKNKYLHFNRVDAYQDFPKADPHDGEQLPRDLPGNLSSTLEHSPDFSAKNYYDKSRARTYACCFSLENSQHIWDDYGGDKDKACITFDFEKLRCMLNETLSSNSTFLINNSVQYPQIFSINYGIIDYIDRNTEQRNTQRLPNPITYTFCKDTYYDEEKELRISLSALGIGKYSLNNSKEVCFHENLQLGFDFHTALEKNVIKEITYNDKTNFDYLRSELRKLKIETT